MALFVPIGPSRIISPLIENKTHDNGWLMLLAPQVIKFKEDYNYMLRRFGGNIFLDNGAAEKGKHVIVENMEEAVSIIRSATPHSNIVACLPDVLGQADLTINAVDNNLDAWRKLKVEDFMAIPQGTTHHQFMECHVELRKIIGFASFWGVPRHLTAKLGTRRWVIEDLANQLGEDERIHMLGFSDHIADDLACAKMPQVYSIDSHVPTMYGALGIPMHEHMHIVRDVHYWDYAGYQHMCAINLRWAYNRCR